MVGKTSQEACMAGPEHLDGAIRVPVDTVREQIAGFLRAWGMPEDHLGTTADVMVDADVCGIDTHGISMIPSYHQRQTDGLLTIDATIEVVSQTPVSALLDAGGGLGHVPSVRAMQIAIDKATAVGMAAVSVRNSNHYGAAGYYTRMAAAAGLLGMSTTNVAGPRSAPTFGKEARLSTNPLAFAAPTARNPAFSLDMSTTTVSAGRVRNHANEGVAIPIGWANDPDGRPITDPQQYEQQSRSGATLSPLGGTADGASYKGYGLGAMVEILSAGLSGAGLVTSRADGVSASGSTDLGHFFLAIDPKIFRGPGEFEATVDDLIDDLHATTPIDPDQPVLVAGEPENRIRAERTRDGIPVAPGLRQRLASIAATSGTDFLLD
jgi:LDH2 family malate/lactate/ureidoglycolate dehydrogenase